MQVVVISLAGGEGLIDHVGQIAVGPLHGADVNDAVLVDDEDLVLADLARRVRDDVADAVAEPGVERFHVSREGVAHLREARDFELVRLLAELLLQRGEELLGRGEHRAVWQSRPVLLHVEQELPRLLDLRHAAGGEVDEVVAVLGDLGVEGAQPRVRPVLAEEGGDVAHDIRLGDRAVDVGDDELRRLAPEEDGRRDVDLAAQGRAGRKADRVGPRVQIEPEQVVVVGEDRARVRRSFRARAARSAARGLVERQRRGVRLERVVAVAVLVGLEARVRPGRRGRCVCGRDLAVRSSGGADGRAHRPRRLGASRFVEIRARHQVGGRGVRVGV
mmetsp:Transcript_4233/g.13540  ORF Transcript_4233/g.13540 Transcript_4233/m.13540 type:complete len:332 (-) Transcript_4233:1639-2634(-)